MRGLALLAAGAGRARAVTTTSAPAPGRPEVVDRTTAGTEVWRITTEDHLQTNIYCELPYCSRDGRLFVYERTDPKRRRTNPTQFIVVETGTWKQHLLDEGRRTTGCFVSRQGVFFYLKRTAGRAVDLMRADLSIGRPEAVYRFRRDLVGGSLGSLSADGRYFVFGQRLDESFSRFGLVLVDLVAQTETVIDEDPFNYNPHPQFDPASAGRLLVQHNRGSRFRPDGSRERAFDDQGATLYLLSVPQAVRSPLPVGAPHTTFITGHQAWVADTGEILLSVVAEGDFAPEKGNLLAVRPGGTPRVAARGCRFNHVHVSRCGRFFCCDDWEESCRLVLGSIRTGRTEVLCASGASRSGGPHTHPHAYLTGDLNWVIFNSDRGGTPHIHAAAVPPGLLEQLDRA